MLVVIQHSVLFYCYIGNFISYIAINAPQGCAVRGVEVNCYAIPRTR